MSSSSSKDRFEKTFSRKKKESTIKNNNGSVKNKSTQSIKPKSPSSSETNLPKPSRNFSKSQPPNKKNKPPADLSRPKKKPLTENVGAGKEEVNMMKPMVVALLGIGSRSGKRDGNSAKDQKRKPENVGAGKQEVKKIKATTPAAKNGKSEKKGKEKKEKDEEESVECVFPTARISRIVKSEGSDYRLSGEAVFLINKATEKFIGLFSEDAYSFAIDDRKSFIGYRHLSSAVSKGKQFDFLSDFVPEKVAAEKALGERKSSETQPA